MSRALIFLLISLCGLTQAVWGQFSISLSFEGSLSSEQEAVFSEAANSWEDYIVGYLPGTSLDASSRLSGLSVTITDAITGDGVGGAIVGDSGPDNAIFQNGFFLPTVGTVQFDPADIDLVNYMELLTLAKREIGHVLGLGTLWSINGLYAPGSGQYLGAFGLEAYQSEFDPSASFVPVELGGVGNIINGHWNENDFGNGLTGITDAFGRDFANELMTGWLGPDAGQTFLSETTVMSLQDLGYLVQLAAPALPEPSFLLLIHLAALFGLGRRSRS